MHRYRLGPLNTIPPVRKAYLNKKIRFLRTGLCTPLPVAESLKDRLHSGRFELPILDNPALWALRPPESQVLGDSVPA